MNDGPVYIVDDDEDDHEYIKEIWKELGYKNELVFFDNGEAVLRRMKADSTVPFLILCDVNIPRMDGFELKKRLYEDDTLNHKSIPFIFWSSQVSKEQIKKSYDLGGNGFFAKENTMSGLKASLIEIMQYWLKSKVPVE
ncbi:MAG TPA: response regulator [Chitinophagaceae bacterium]|nr:response regulator [Chitinophagaceae bacterium]